MLTLQSLSQKSCSPRGKGASHSKCGTFRLQRLLRTRACPGQWDRDSTAKSLLEHCRAFRLALVDRIECGGQLLIPLHLSEHDGGIRSHAVMLELCRSLG